jgi:hypothetical protein
MRRLTDLRAASLSLCALSLTLAACGGITTPADSGGTGAVALKVYQSAHPARGYIDANGGLYTHINPGQFEAYGGAPLSGYSWTITTGTSAPFPALIVDPLTGLAHGSLPAGATVGHYLYQVTASDGVSTYSSSGAYIDVVACNSANGSGAALPANCSANLPPSCGSGTLADINLGGLSPYKAASPVGFSLFVNNGTPPYKNWALASGSLPPGLTIDASRGVLTGTPLSSASGNTYTFSVKVTDAANVTCPATGASPASYKISIQ